MKDGAIKQLVIDASVAVAWCFADETTRFTERVLDPHQRLAVAIDPPQIARAFDQILSVARQRNLTGYDAAYLELVVRRNLPLATLDDA